MARPPVAGESAKDRSEGTPLIVGLGVLAVCATLTRQADGSSAIPAWAGALLQGPLVAAWLARQVGWRQRDNLRRPPATERVLTAIVILSGVATAIARGSADAFFIATTTFVWGCLAVDYLGGLLRRVEALIATPALMIRAIIGPWAMLTVLTTILLSLPLATRPGLPDYAYNFWLHVLNSFYSAISTSCLVGGGVYSFGEDYSSFGQAVIFTTTQLAGLAFSAIGLAILQPFLRTPVALRWMILFSVILQLLAVAVMWSAWSASDADGPVGRFWWGLVHSGNALLNSGWTIRADGFAAYLGRSRVFATLATLSIVGSIGMPVIMGFAAGKRQTSAATVRKSLPPARPWQKLPWLEVVTTLALLSSVAVFIFVMETPRILPAAMAPSRPVDFGENRVSIRDNMTHQERWGLSLFTSCTLRSAGLQSIPLSEGAISWPTYVLMLGCMFVGGSAAGVAGGVRVSSVLLLAIVLFSTTEGWKVLPDGAALRRKLRRGLLNFIACWLGVSFAVVLLLALLTDGTWYELIFEPIAAVNGVGLSTGLSLHLTSAGRLVMILAMVAGKWMPATFLLRQSAALARVAS